MSKYLGIDTSNYRTSVCLLDEAGCIEFERRQLLYVPQGKLGLRQQEAVFQHLKSLGAILEELGPLFDTRFGVTDKPRPVEGSYMPCFLVGESFTRALAAGQGYLCLSHQENHIWAGLSENPDLIKKPFIAGHISGGTTEFVLVSWENKMLKIKELGGTTDISAGQFLDRVGVAMGLPFPAGVYLEEMAKPSELRLGVKVIESSLSYSGPETKAKELIQKGIDGRYIAYAAFLAVAKSVGRVLTNLIAATKVTDVLLVGGVMANGIIRERLKQDLHHSSLAKLCFASPKASGDNALGVATAIYWGENS